MKRKAICLEEKNQRQQLNPQQALDFFKRSSINSFHPHMLINGDGRFLNLTGAKLSGHILIGCDFTGAHLAHADFKGAQLSNAIFYQSQLQYASFEESILDQVIFNECELSHAFFKKNDLRNTRFYRSQLSHASFDKMPKLEPLPLYRTLRVQDHLFGIQAWTYAQNPTKPPMILLHGFGGLASDFEALAGAFKDQYQLYAISITGHDTSNYPELSQYEDPDQNGNIDLSVYQSQRENGFLKEISILAEVIDQILAKNNHQHCILIGYSLGGRLALQLSLHPLLSHRLKAMVLLGAHPGLADATLKAQRWESDFQWIDRLIQDDSLSDFFRHWYAQPLLSQLAQQRPEFFQKRLKEQIKKHNAMGLIFALFVFSLANMPSAWDQLNQIQVPTLWLNGELDLKFCQIAQLACAKMPFAYVNEVKAAGHQAFLEKPEQCEAYISAFLAHIDEV